MQRRLPHARTSPKANHFYRATQQPMSQMRLGATCVLVRTMFWDWQVGHARMQEMRGNGEEDSLPERSLTQAGPFWIWARPVQTTRHILIYPRRSRADLESPHRRQCYEALVRDGCRGQLSSWHCAPKARALACLRHSLVRARISSHSNSASVQSRLAGHATAPRRAPAPPFVWEDRPEKAGYPNLPLMTRLAW